MSAPSQRLLSVDAFRGMTIVGMILVNNPGDWGAIYAPLRHAEWHGWTPTDLIFPFFLFIVGVAIVLALGRRVAEGTDRRALTLKIARRAAVLFALGLFLSGFPFGLFGPRSFERLLETWRIAGVLQRIAVCYLAASLLFIFCRRATLRAVTVGLLVGYWALMTLVPIPGQGAPDIHTPDGHLAAWVDQQVLGNHIWSGSKVYDPEGILSTLPSIATTLLGIFAGLLLAAPRSESSPDDVPEKIARLFVFGTLLVIVGYVWNWFFPINKPIWTSSYAVFTAGLAACGLALCTWFFDVLEWRRVARPFTIYGVNAITVFVGSGVVALTLAFVKIGGKSLQHLIFSNLFSSWLPPKPASLGYALTWITCWFLVLLWMDRRGIRIKV